MNRFLCDINSSINYNATAYKFSQQLNDASIYLLPILAIIGNSLTLFVILTNPQLNRSSFSVYVKSMAITDTLALLFKFLSYINKTYIYFPSMCTILIFCAEASVLLSVWTIVLITIERTLVVLFPLHIKKFVSAYRARILVTTIAALIIIFSIRVLFIPIEPSDSSNKYGNRCRPNSNWTTYIQVNVTITEFAYCYIPLALVIIGNFLTVCTVTKAINRRHDMIINNSDHQKRQMDSNKNQLTLMLLIVTLMFIVYFVPYTIMNVLSRVGLPFQLCFTPKSMEIYTVIRALADLLKDLNFCTNFIIYCVSGRRFRHGFFSLFKIFKRQSSANSHYFDSHNHRHDFYYKKNQDTRLLRLSPKNTMDETQFSIKICFSCCCYVCEK